MEPSGLGLFKRLNARMQWLAKRQSVLAENVANVNTPGYRSRDVTAPRFENAMAAAKSAAPPPPPQPKHFRLVSQLAPENTAETDGDEQITISGNSVDLEHELKKAADAAMEHQTMTQLYRKHLEMLRMATSNNGA